MGTTSEVIHPDKHIDTDLIGSANRFGRFVDFNLDTNHASALITYENLPVFVEFFQSGVVRIATGTKRVEIPVRTAAVVDATPTTEAIRVKQTNDALSFVTDSVIVTFQADSPAWKVSRRAEDGSFIEFYHLIGIESAGDQGIKAYQRKDTTNQFYGLGEKTGFLNKQGERYTMWNSDIYDPHVPDMEALYVSIPFTIHVSDGEAYGLLLDNPGRTAFDMRARDDAYVTEIATNELDTYIIPGPGVKDVLQRYTALTGRISMPPKWALGYHQSRYSYMDQAEVLEVAKTMREKQIPCDAIYLDIHYMRDYRVFTFDPVRFPDPENMIAELNALGFQLVTIVDPGVKCDPEFQPFVDGMKSGMFSEREDGTVYTGPVWPGESAFPDFTSDKVSAWWGDLHQFYTEKGVRGIWNDMNEPSVFNDVKTMDSSVIHDNNGTPVTHGEIHNLYGMLMAKSTNEGLRRALPDNRPFVLTRAGYAGIQRYAAVWTGDNRSYWEHMAMSIPMMLNLGLSGVPFVGSDIGGFSHHTSGELLARWTQLGAFYPYSRNHSCIDTARQEPWAFGTDIEDICRRYIQLRYEWMPYLYSLFFEAKETGLPVTRPLVLEYPDDDRTFNLADEFLVGQSVIVAPVIRPGDVERLVYLPQGTWYNYWSGERVDGAKGVIANAPLDTLPMFIKAGAIIPQSEPVQYTGEPSRTLTIDVYLGDAGTTGEYRFYEDDGNTFAYERGENNLIDFTLRQTEAGLTFAWTHRNQGYASPCQEWKIRFLRGSNAPVQVFGVTDDAWQFDPAKIELTATIRPAAGDGTIEVSYVQ